ncbi:type IV toxin-antitoxin system AbiEi family antitoxin domain-containing protein [Cellulomonas sp. S1-8]|uniref:type IV toxin-antitoxin system AbiEi family antitoxin domain-containing protein n=1 Tax=Cellulomonas sp. S1-8 TaxID=2904790 RepID=UPI0022448F0C|nr:type IV toxin-antitoxin system AbiEi family antitoxin domain-containing protein [Cellulomonas sp. S1-8]UZN02530.1 type IV toxin-antitoxin system AbiEi family antitoxin domain-containing protein [Cellulomonas sp. S1-8]
MSGMVTTQDVAALLDVTPRQVQRLARDGQLVQLARGVLDATSVDQYLAVARHRRAPWSTETAWGAIAMLSGEDAPWMGAAQRSRLRGRLRDIQPTELVERARARATVTRYAGHPATVEHLRPHLVEPDAGGLGLASRAPGVLDGYVPSSVAASYVVGHGLKPDSAGRITLRATTMAQVVVRALAERQVLAALDLAGSLDPREQRAGADALGRALEGLRD